MSSIRDTSRSSIRWWRLAVVCAVALGSAAAPAGAGAQAPAAHTPSERHAVNATSGLGMYVWRWGQTGSVDQVVAKAVASRMSFLIVRASSQPDGFYLGPILEELLPKAHAAGLKVIAYDPPRFEDVEADVQRAYQLISFRASGHGIDAFAADIEPKWHLLTAENADRYGARLREVVGPDFPLVGVVFPPNMVGEDRFPYTEVARHFDVLSPMSYWRARTLDGPGFMAESVRALQAYGRPVSAIGQAFSYDGLRDVSRRGHPPREEFEATIEAAREAGAYGMSFWVWEHAEPWVFDSIRDLGWAGYPLSGLGVNPPVAGPYGPNALTPARPALPSVQEATAVGPSRLPTIPSSETSAAHALALAVLLFAVSALAFDLFAPGGMARPRLAIVLDRVERATMEPRLRRAFDPVAWRRLAALTVAAAERGAGMFAPPTKPIRRRSGRSGPA